MFTRLCSACIAVPERPNASFTVIPTMHGTAGRNSLVEYEITFHSLTLLNEYGLVTNEFDTNFPFDLCIGTSSLEPVHEQILTSFEFQRRHWILVTNSPDNPSPSGFHLSGIALTRSGRELLTVVDQIPMESYANALVHTSEITISKCANLRATLPSSAATTPLNRRAIQAN